MVVNQPTWGVDAGAAARIRQALIELARSGSAVLVISQDLDELFEISVTTAELGADEGNPRRSAIRGRRGTDATTPAPTATATTGLLRSLWVWHMRIVTTAG